MGTTESRQHLNETHRVTRIWKLPYDPVSATTHGASSTQQQLEFRNGMHKRDSTWVILRQEDLGECRIYVDGLDLLTFRLNQEQEVTKSDEFPLPNGAKCYVVIKQNQSWIDRSWKFAYHLFMNGKEYSELNDFHNLQKPRDPPFFAAAVVSNHVMQSPQGEEYVSYGIAVTLKDGDLQPRVIHRRFRDFCMLDLCIRWSWNHHSHFSLETLPKVPERRIKQPGQRNLQSDFISIRQQKLEVYLKQVLKLPRAEEYPDILAFFGFVDTLDDITYYSDKVPEGGIAQAANATNPNPNEEGASNATGTHTSVAEPSSLVLDDFEKLLVSVDQDHVDLICKGSSQRSQEYMSKLAADSSVEMVLRGLFQTDNVKPLMRGFNRVRRRKDIFNEEEFQQWCDSQLPSIPDLLKNRVQLICQQIRPKRPFPPRLDDKSVIIDDSTLKFLSTAFIEAYNAPLWNRLYASFSNGLSFQTICTAVEGYEGPTMIIIQDSFGCRFGALATGRWREETAFFASLSGAVFSIAPVFSVYRRLPLSTKPKSKNVQYMNSRSRTLPLGMGFGGELHSRNSAETAPHPRLWIDAEFDTCFATSGVNDAVYEPGPLLGDDLTRETFHVAHIEVWGLGGEDGIKARDTWRAQKERMLLKQRQVDKAQFANNSFDREFLLNGTFNGNKRETNDN